MPHRASTAARLIAAVIALAASVGLGLEVAGAIGLLGSPLAALSVLLRYFTITTNLIVALVFTGLAAARDLHSRIVAGTALAIGLVGIVYHALLSGVVPLSAGGPIANLLLHSITPILAPLYWLAFARKGALRRLDPLLWSLYPLGYLGYALVRGARGGLYAYPFINPARAGPGAVALTCAAIAFAFVAAGYGLVWLDGRMARRAVGRDVRS